MNSDINEITVGGKIFGPIEMKMQGQATIYRATIKSVHVTKRQTTIESYHHVEAWGELGNKLKGFREGQKIVVKGRMTSYRGISKATGEPYISFFKIAPSEIHMVEQADDCAQPSNGRNQWAGVPKEPERAEPLFMQDSDDIPF